jgi:hypothetical protein
VKHSLHVERDILCADFGRFCEFFLNPIMFKIFDRPVLLSRAEDWPIFDQLDINHSKHDWKSQDKI